MEIKVNLPLKMPILMWGVWVHQHSTLAIQDKCKRTKEVWEQFGIEISAQSQVKGLKVLLLAQWGSDWCGPRGVEHGSGFSSITDIFLWKTSWTMPGLALCATSSLCRLHSLQISAVVREVLTGADLWPELWSKLCLEIACRSSYALLHPPLKCLQDCINVPATLQNFSLTENDHYPNNTAGNFRKNGVFHSNTIFILPWEQ